MKKILIILSLSSCSHQKFDVVWYSKNLNKVIENIETMEDWVKDDYLNGDIETYCANNYLLLLENTKLSIQKHKDYKPNTNTKR
jgi:hypothetical protein